MSCLWCGAEFEVHANTHHEQKFCTTACRQASWRADRDTEMASTVAALADLELSDVEARSVAVSARALIKAGGSPTVVAGQLRAAVKGGRTRTHPAT